MNTEILIIEDDPVIRKELQTVLKKLGKILSNFYRCV